MSGGFRRPRSALPSCLVRAPLTGAMRAAAPVALVHSACIGDLLKSSFANYIASPAGAPAIWPFPFAVWYAVSAEAAISSGARVAERSFLMQKQRRQLLSIYQRKWHYLIHSVCIFSSLLCVCTNRCISPFALPSPLCIK